MERVAKWGTVLRASNIKCMPRTYVKELVLTGLVARLDKSPLGKLVTSKKNLSTRQNQGLAWSSDSNLWRN